MTEKLSSQTRTTAIGVLALTWGLLIGDSPAAKAISVQLKPGLLLLGAASVCVLFFDFLQYVAGYLATKSVFEDLERRKAQEKGEYDYEKLSYRLRKFFFTAKQVVLILTVVTLFVVIGGWIVSSRQTPTSSPVGTSTLSSPH